MGVTAFCVVQTRTMKTIVALALFVAAASAYTTTLQDRIVLYPHMMAKNPARGSGRIVGGQEAVPNSYPHLVFLLIDSLYVCGGNIFNENTSFGSIFGCEVGAPACFTSIPNYLDWLNENG